jgi:hypothetical protein
MTRVYSYIMQNVWDANVYSNVGNVLTDNLQ